MTKLAKLIAQEEGFFKSGSLPQRNNNPGDLRHSPHSHHTPDAPQAIGVIDTVEHGWEDLERQLLLDADRGLTIQEFVQKFAPPEENDSHQYLQFLCTGLSLPPHTLLSDALKIGDA